MKSGPGEKVVGLCAKGRPRVDRRRGGWLSEKVGWEKKLAEWKSGLSEKVGWEKKWTEWKSGRPSRQRLTEVNNNLESNCIRSTIPLTKNLNKQTFTPLQAPLMIQVNLTRRAVLPSSQMIFLQYEKVATKMPAENCTHRSMIYFRLDCCTMWHEWGCFHTSM